MERFYVNFGNNIHFQFGQCSTSDKLKRQNIVFYDININNNNNNNTLV